MAKPCADIKPTGLIQRDLVDVLYQIITSIEGACTKLDNDATVPLTTYVANCVTGIFNCIIENSRGNRFQTYHVETTTIPVTAFASPRGIGGRDLLDILYMICDSLETLAEQLDTDVLTGSAFETTYFDPSSLHLPDGPHFLITNSKDQSIGQASNSRSFHLGSIGHKDLVDMLYIFVNGLDGLLIGINADATPTDKNYEALWYTNTILLTVENSAGASIGN
jgi:hypothetical protein